MGQSAEVFAQHGYPGVENWQQVSAPGRRRRSYFDGEHTLAVFIASRSDIDDLVPMITAYQIERSKLYHRLNKPHILSGCKNGPQSGNSHRSAPIWNGWPQYGNSG
jgi:hypothetical protein